jgi:hypothetical protein
MLSYIKIILFIDKIYDFMGLFVHGFFLADFPAGFKLDHKKYPKFEATP